VSELSIRSADQAVDTVQPWLLRYRGLIAAEAIWLIFAANFNVGYLWGGDSHVAYAFLRALVGSGQAGTGYQFGLALFEAPFYGIGRLMQDMGVETIGTHPTPEAAIAAGAVFYIGLALAFTYALLAKLGFRHPGLAATCALFGSPLFYYGTFSPGQTHAVETMLACAAIFLVYVGHTKGWPPMVAITTGFVLGVAPTVRYFLFVFGVALVAMLLSTRRWRPAVMITVSAAVVLGLLLLLPAAIGVRLFASGDPQTVLAFSPTSPIHMLFGPRRGLFFWTPLTFIAAIGLVRALMRANRRDRWFLSTVIVMAVLLILVQVSITFWYAGWSFSQRYLTALYPIVAIGFASVIQWRAKIALGLAVPAVAWSLFLCMNMQTIGFDEHHDNVFSLASRAGAQTPGAYAWGVWHISHLRSLIHISG
jgi:hypothetical protein